MRRLVLAAVGGVLFALGLALSDMTSPARVRAFLDVGGDWDPTLAFVMMGAIAVYAPLARMARARPSPFLATRFDWPERRDIDVRLVGGAALFGVGWGLAGYCPGPALVALGSLTTPILVFTAALVGGIAIARLALRPRA